MKTKKVECPKCLGTGEVMVAKKTRGFNYVDCSLCNKEGIVEKDIANDFILSQNEENVEFDED